MQSSRYSFFLTLMVGAIIGAIAYSVAFAVCFYFTSQKPIPDTPIGFIMLNVWFFITLILNVILSARAKIGLGTNKGGRGLIIFCFITSIISVNPITFVAAFLGCSKKSQALPNQMENPNNLNANGNANDVVNKKQSQAFVNQSRLEKQLQQNPNDFQPRD